VESINAFAACHDLTHCHHGMLLVCQRCGAISELHEPEIEQALLDKIKRSGYRLATDAAELKGICPACQALESPAERQSSDDAAAAHHHRSDVSSSSTMA